MVLNYEKNRHNPKRWFNHMFWKLLMHNSNGLPQHYAKFLHNKSGALEMEADSTVGHSSEQQMPQEKVQQQIWQHTQSLLRHCYTYRKECVRT
jgi:hypothetical protein